MRARRTAGGLAIFERNAVCILSSASAGIGIRLRLLSSSTELCDSRSVRRAKCLHSSNSSSVDSALLAARRQSTSNSMQAHILFAWELHECSQNARNFSRDTRNEFLIAQRTVNKRRWEGLSHLSVGCRSSIPVIGSTRGWTGRGSRIRTPGGTSGYLSTAGVRHSDCAGKGRTSKESEAGTELLIP